MSYAQTLHRSLSGSLSLSSVSQSVFQLPLTLFFLCTPPPSFLLGIHHVDEAPVNFTKQDVFLESKIWTRRLLLTALGLMWCQLWCLIMERAQIGKKKEKKNALQRILEKGKNVVFALPCGETKSINHYMIPLVLSVLKALTS